jgi:hypothetical protein
MEFSGLVGAEEERTAVTPADARQLAKLKYDEPRPQTPRTLFPEIEGLVGVLPSEARGH